MHIGDERAIEFVALATRDDLNANAEFIRLADTFIEVPSGSNKVPTFFCFFWPMCLSRWDVSLTMR